MPHYRGKPMYKEDKLHCCNYTKAVTYTDSSTYDIVSALNPYLFYQRFFEAGPMIESVPIENQKLRNNRALFCMGQYCFRKVPLDKWTRWLTDSVMHPEFLLRQFNIYTKTVIS